VSDRHIKKQHQQQFRPQRTGENVRNVVVVAVVVVVVAVVIVKATLLIAS